MGRRTRVIGLTGSIGMGKSTAASMLERLHVPVFYADNYAHGLLQPGGGAVAAVRDAFPEVVENGVISRPALGRAVFGDAAALERLEEILHPLVRRGEHKFIARQNLRRIPIAALEIPLLFETRAELLCDVVVVLTAPPFVQEARVMARPGMTKARLEAVRARQMPEQVKCARADFVVSTGLGLRRTFLGLKAIVRELR